MIQVHILSRTLYRVYSLEQLGNYRIKRKFFGIVTYKINKKYKMKKKAHNLTSFYTIKKRTRDLNHTHRKKNPNAQLDVPLAHCPSSVTIERRSYTCQGRKTFFPNQCIRYTSCHLQSRRRAETARRKVKAPGTVLRAEDPVQPSASRSHKYNRSTPRGSDRCVTRVRATTAVGSSSTPVPAIMSEGP